MNLSEIQPRQILICQNTSCRNLGSAKVFATFQAISPASVDVKKVYCLGACGNGPMVLVLPEQVWYCRVRPEQVPTIVEQHLMGDRPVSSLLYR